MTQAWRDINAMLFGGQNPYEGFVADAGIVDTQGWNSHHVFLGDTMAAARPRIVVEVGVWKGGSSIHMAQALRAAGVDGVVVSVDTFLGSWEHYEQPAWFPSLRLKHGYPTLFYTFLTNVVASGVGDYIQPLPLDSANAYFVLKRKGVRPDVVHIDAGHDFDAVTLDLRMWWSLLAPGGTMIMDDYDANGVVWPSVRDAVDAFLGATPHEGREAVPYKLRVRKIRST